MSWEKVRRIGLEANADTTERISAELRGPGGMGVTRLASATALQPHSDIVFPTGTRSRPKIELISANGDAVVIAFVTPKQLRIELSQETMRTRALTGQGGNDYRLMQQRYGGG